MALKTELSFTGAHSFPDILKDATLPDDIIDRIDPLAPISTKIVEFDEEIPTTGIWLPINHPLACPNYFEVGYSENVVEVPTLKEQSWGSEEDFKKGLPPDSRDISYDEIEGKFILLWEEDRYRKGRIPDEPLILFPPK